MRIPTRLKLAILVVVCGVCATAVLGVSPALAVTGGPQ